ncbi:hypothetical protein CRE_19728 [Caenorhabditis remanei]|uniref:Uncharacterized protein n=1 Tax=Caenorhabditis remanei TaxID=31234 RepID=E3MTH7_CAERE|nr:hypothetical protein CRE_19728 [Caenorhabditis remanei]
MSTTSALEFSNLPTDTIGRIIEKCDLKEHRCTGFFLFDRISDAVLCGFKFYCLTMDTLFSLRNIFSRSPTFKHCNIECVYLPLIEELAVELGLRLEPGNYLPVFYQYLIPDSTDVLIYEFWMDHIEIRRVSYMEML